MILGTQGDLIVLKVEGLSGPVSRASNSDLFIISTLELQVLSRSYRSSEQSDISVPLFRLITDAGARAPRAKSYCDQRAVVCRPAIFGMHEGRSARSRKYCRPGGQGRRSDASGSFVMRRGLQALPIKKSKGEESMSLRVGFTSEARISPRDRGFPGDHRSFHSVSNQPSSDHPLS